MKAALNNAGYQAVRKVRKRMRSLEAEFSDGMTWPNYGRWHVDHIRPRASFDFEDPNQQRDCFNYMNLQPLWGQENCAKRDRV